MPGTDPAALLRTDLETARALVHRLADNLAIFVNEHTDPGTEALSALWLAQHEPRPVGTLRVGTDPERREAIARLIAPEVGRIVESFGEDDEARRMTSSQREGLGYAIDVLANELPDRLVSVLLGETDGGAGQ
jgi:hypothetical protein